MSERAISTRAEFERELAKVREQGFAIDDQESLEGLRCVGASVRRCAAGGAAIAADVPLVVQDASAYVGSALSIDLRARLHAELGERVLFKPEAHPIGQKITELRAATGRKARILEGTGGMYLIDSFRRCAVGTPPADDQVWALVPLWRALTAGDFDRAYRIAGPLAQLVSLQSSLDIFVAVEKHLLVRRGVFPAARVRRPLGVPSTSRRMPRSTAWSSACAPRSTTRRRPVTDPDAHAVKDGLRLRTS